MEVIHAKDAVSIAAPTFGDLKAGEAYTYPKSNNRVFIKTAGGGCVDVEDGATWNESSLHAATLILRLNAVVHVA